MITGAVNRVEPRAIILDVGNNVEAILATTEQSAGRALPDRPERQGLRPRGPSLEPRPADPRQPDPQGLPEAPVRARGARDPQRHRRDQGDRPRGRARARRSRSRRARRASTRSARPSASAARASRPSSPSSAARRSTSSRGTTTPGVFVANALSPAQVLGVDIDEEHRIANVTVPERMLSLAIGREGQNARLAARLTGWRIDIRSDVSVAEAKAAADEPTKADDAPSPRSRSRRRRASRADAAREARRDAARRQPAARPRRRGEGQGRRAATERRRGREGDGRRRRRRPPRRRPPPATSDGRPRRRRRRRPTATNDTKATAPRTAERRLTARRRRRSRAGRRRPPRRWAVVEDLGRMASRARLGLGERIVARAPGAPGRARIPTRSCVACRTARPKRDLVRIVRTPDGDIDDRRNRPAGRQGCLPLPRRRLLDPRARARRPRACARGTGPGGAARGAGGGTVDTDNDEGGARGQE